MSSIYYLTLLGGGRVQEELLWSCDDGEGFDECNVIFFFNVITFFK